MEMGKLTFRRFISKNCNQSLSRRSWKENFENEIATIIVLKNENKLRAVDRQISSNDNDMQTDLGEQHEFSTQTAFIVEQILVWLSQRVKIEQLTAGAQTVRFSFVLYWKQGVLDKRQLDELVSVSTQLNKEQFVSTFFADWDPEKSANVIRFRFDEQM